MYLTTASSWKPPGLANHAITKRLSPVDMGVGDTLDFEALPLSQKFTLATLQGIALWNAGEIMLLVYWTFKVRWRTLYFWSIVAADLGVIMCAVSQIIYIWDQHRNDILTIVMGSAGWVPMVTGQSLVLYSRLHLLGIEAQVRHLILAAIIFNAVTVHGATIVLAICANTSDSTHFLKSYSIMEKVQIIIFFVQELGLSAIYLWQASSFLKRHSTSPPHMDNSTSSSSGGRMVKDNLRSLILVNIMVILLDATIMVLEYLGLYVFQLSGKNFVYSVKLKVEFGILSRLRDFLRQLRQSQQQPGDNNTSERRRKESRVRMSIQRQWNSTLRKAFGSTAGRTRTEDRTCDSPRATAEGGTRQISSTYRKRYAVVAAAAAASRNGADERPSEFWNVPVFRETWDAQPATHCAGREQGSDNSGRTDTSKDVQLQ